MERTPALTIGPRVPRMFHGIEVRDVRFIKVTKVLNGEPFYVAAEHVSHVVSHNLGFLLGSLTKTKTQRTTWVHLVGGQHVIVAESLEVVMAALGAEVGGKTVDALS